MLHFSLVSCNNKHPEEEGESWKILLYEHEKQCLTRIQSNNNFEHKIPVDFKSLLYFWNNVKFVERDFSNDCYTTGLKLILLCITFTKAIRQ